MLWVWIRSAALRAQVALCASAAEASGQRWVSRGRISARRKFRRRCVSALLGSSIQRSACSCAYSASAVRGCSSSGRQIEPLANCRNARMPPRPSGPAPRRSLSRMVSAWSSRWCASARISAGASARSNAARRARRAASSRPVPASFDIDHDHIERNIQARRECAAMLRPTCAVGVQVVIDVNRAQAAFAYIRNLRERMQEYARIHATAETYGNAARRQMFQAGVYRLDQRLRRHASMVPELHVLRRQLLRRTSRSSNVAAPVIVAGQRQTREGSQ